MLRVLLSVLSVLMLVCSGAQAKNLAFPEKDPVATIVIPDQWKTVAIEYGWETKSPNDDIYFSIEYGREKTFDKIVDGNEKWMRDNKITIKSDVNKNPINLGGLAGEILTYQAVDENGPTYLSFIVLNGGKRLILMTLWGSEEEFKANDKAVNAMMDSIKLIN